MTGRPRRRHGPVAGRTRPIPMTLFMVGRHEVRFWSQEGRWTAAVDGNLLPQWFPSHADAWTAAVCEADRVDHRAAS